LNDGRASEALLRLEEALATSNELSGTDRATYKQRIDEVANRLVATHGLLLSPTRGEFTLGSPAGYDAALLPILLDAAKGRSLAPKPAKSPFLPLWDRLAPYRVEIEVTESYTALYLQSKSRISTIQGKVKLSRGGEVYWQADLTGRTRVPVAGLPAYIASRLAVSDKVDLEAERRLYDDAFESFREQFGTKVRGLRPPARPGRSD
jgi:hypothetical protein